VKRRLVSAVALAAALFTAPACVRLRFEQTNLQRPLPRAVQERVAPGMALAECLELLGAPNVVWEQPDGKLALAYAWSHSFGWGFAASVDVARNANASFDFDDLSEDVYGVALFFDRDWKLVESQRGRLRELTDLRARRRPNIFFPGANPSTPPQ
jgi:hypothetical protein